MGYCHAVCLAGLKKTMETPDMIVDVPAKIRISYLQNESYHLNQRARRTLCWYIIILFSVRACDQMVLRSYFPFLLCS
jgi:hypothetical protein